MRVESRIDIHAPAERIFAFIADVERQPEWIGAVTGVSSVSTSPAALGTTFRLSLALMGKTAEADQKVTGFEPGRRFAQSTTSGPIPTEITITLTEAGGVTTVHNVTDADISSLGRFAAPIATRTIRRQLDTDLATLKSIMERG
jgi:carbon monoxide dehydrogenase subunit G